MNRMRMQVCTIQVEYNNIERCFVPWFHLLRNFFADFRLLRSSLRAHLNANVVSEVASEYPEFMCQQRHFEVVHCFVQQAKVYRIAVPGQIP